MEHLSPKEKIAIMIAIIGAMFFAAVNQTIVGNALPVIISDLGGLDLYSWVFTIYMLTSAITTILAGKLSDIYGRKPFLIIGIIIFSIGAFLAGTSTTIIQMITYRGIQGLGAGFIMSAAFTAVGDLFAPRERGKWQGAMSAVFGISSVFGPTLGGYIVDNYEWKWVFWVFLPLGIIALGLIWKLFPSSVKREGEKIDYLGSLFLMSTIVTALLGFSWAGTKYDWGSAEILVLFAASILSLCIFVAVERKAKSPILPLHLFKNGIFTISNIIGFVIGVSMFGGVMYVPFYIQGVLGFSATHSSFLTMSMTLGLVAASALGGQLISKTGKYKLQAIIGLSISAFGLFLLSQMGINTSQFSLVLYLILVGFGLGIGMTVFTLTVQNAVDQSYLGVATASSQLFRSIGGTVGVAIMGTLLNTRMADRMESFPAPDSSVSPEIMDSLQSLQNPHLLLDHRQLDQIVKTIPSEALPLFQETFEHLKVALTYALSGVFLFVTVVMVVGIFLAFFLKEVPLRSASLSTKENEKNNSEAKADIDQSLHQQH
ncbi:MDR family MFS transporter [Jeotgalibacillus soli]|uniref:MFS transporter n=1 Tax=Jeotgalibacillus soli TaxID=889306 RepID=A0A0C2R4N6_9BACL|nr:MDR family MFS transporter [Jeotgalibacillus soli]KIL45235.1 MFS transporter [Jeotgalibacillus soli]